MNKKHFGDTALGWGLAFAAVILAFFMGIGGCLHLANVGGPDKYIDPLERGLSQ